MSISRKLFLATTSMATAAVLLSNLESLAIETKDKKLRIGLIGCGSVSGRYLPHLKTSELLEVVSLCYIRYQRAVNRGTEFGITNTYPNIEAMLAGVPFDMMVTTTDMQEHGRLNKIALEEG